MGIRKLWVKEETPYDWLDDILYIIYAECLSDNIHKYIYDFYLVHYKPLWLVGF